MIERYREEYEKVSLAYLIFNAFQSYIINHPNPIKALINILPSEIRATFEKIRESYMEEYDKVRAEIENELSKLDAEEEEEKRPVLMQYLRELKEEYICEALIKALEEHDVYPLKIRELRPYLVRAGERK